MPRAKKECNLCGDLFVPKRDIGRNTCWPCEMKGDRSRTVGKVARCSTCARVFVPPKGAPDIAYCVACRRAADGDIPENPFDVPPGTLPAASPAMPPPMRQIVFDLETWGLDRGWGVVMVGSMLIHGPEGPIIKTFDLREFQPWREGRRSDDSQLTLAILKELHEGDILYAHNGNRFDVPFLNSVALKYGMPRLNARLVDPCKIAFTHYRIGSNSLSSLAQFMNLEEQKMPVQVETWRRAMLDSDDDSWAILRERCESDVRVLNGVASRVIKDVGRIDNRGSAF